MTSREILKNILSVRICSCCKVLIILGFLIICALEGNASTNQVPSWPVFYDSRQGPIFLSIPREPQKFSAYTNTIPDWNRDLHVPSTKIKSVEQTELGRVDGMRVVEARLALTAKYYTDERLIVEEVNPGRYLPVYVQDYNHYFSSPAPNIIFKERQRLIVETGMDYKTSDHPDSRDKIIISPDQNPIVTAP